jgi:hypothetical protein
MPLGRNFLAAGIEKIHHRDTEALRIRNRLFLNPES